MRKGTLKIMSRVLPSWVSSALTWVVRRRFIGSGMSAASTSQGPSGVQPSRLFTRRFGPIVVFQVVADGVVVGHGVAGDVVVGARLRDVAPVPPDDHRQLALVVHVGRVGRPARVPAMADDGVAALEEHQRRFRRLEGQLLGVVGVVEADREDRARLDRRQPRDLVEADCGHQRAAGRRRPRLRGGSSRRTRCVRASCGRLSKRS